MKISDLDWKVLYSLGWFWPQYNQKEVGGVEDTVACPNIASLRESSLKQMAGDVPADCSGSVSDLCDYPYGI